MKSKLLITFLLFSCQIQLITAGERDDLAQVLKEVHYLKDVVHAMKRKNSKRRGKVRFNYDALIAQLTAIEYGTKEYLNNKIQEIHLSPPKPLRSSLYDVRKN